MIKTKDNCNREHMLSKLTKPQLVTEVLLLDDEVATLWRTIDKMRVSAIKNYRKELSLTVEQKLQEMLALMRPVRHAYTPNPNRGYHRDNVAYRQTYCNQQSFVRDQ